MQNTVAALLLVTASIVLTCVVIDYAVGVVEATLQTSNIPQLDRLRDIENSVLNQTDALWNQTLPDPTSPSLPP